MSGKQRIGIFGGTFNPVHFGHLRGAEEAAELLSLDRVLFVPSHTPPLKQKHLAPFRDRLRMVRLAVGGNPRFSVSDIEARRTGKSYTVVTLGDLKREYRDADLFLLLGMDAFLDLPRWYRPAEIVDAVDVAVLVRPPFPVRDAAGSPFLGPAGRRKLRGAQASGKIVCTSATGNRRIIFLGTTPVAISATGIRARRRKGRSIKYLLPQKVESFIISHGLFRP